MFCMHCGQQLPDGAKFCYNCGNKTFSDEDLTASTEPVAEPAEESAQELTEEPIHEPIRHREEPVDLPAEEPVYQQAAPVAPPKKKKEKRVKEPGAAPGAMTKNKKILAILGVAAVLVLILAVALVAVTSSGDKTEIPDPEYYFALPISDTTENDGIISYTIHANDDSDLSDAVYAYIATLENDYEFMINNNEEDTGYINTHLMGIGDSYGEVVVFYLHDYSDNMIVVKTTKNIRLESGVSYSGALSGEADENTTEEQETIQEAVGLGTGDPAVLPDFAEYDATGTFSYFTSFFTTTTEYPDRLYFSYISKDPSAVYQVNSYVEVLYDIGYVLDYIDDDNGYHLYHPDVDAPTLPGEKAQIIVHGHVNESGDTAFVSFTIPEEICIKNYENKYRETAEWYENREANKDNDSSSSSGSSSGSSSSGGSSSFDNDSSSLYDNDPICGVCNGDGDCSKCGGDGYLMSSASDEEDRNCYKCSGSGNCSSCGGDGRL